MKLSSETLAILKNFASINSNLIFQPGKKLVTRSNMGQIRAVAQVEEEFEVESPIYDLNQFLNLVGISQHKDIDFLPSYVIIEYATGGYVSLTYAPPNIIKKPSLNEPDVVSLFSFDISQQEMGSLQKTANIIAATMMTVKTQDDGTVQLVMSDPRNRDAHKYIKTYTENAPESEFTFDLPIENFQPLLADGYSVVVGYILVESRKIPVFEFASTNRPLKYVIAANTTSVIK